MTAADPQTFGSSTVRFVLPAAVGFGVGSIAALRLGETGGLRLAVATGVLVALTLGRSRAASGAASGRRVEGVLAVLAFLALGHAAAVDLWHFATTPRVRVWNVYHYYLGAKYFGELGYHDLYDASLAADAGGRGYWSGVDRVRDLRSYRVRRRGDARFEWRERFSPRRWEAFRDDLEALQVQRRPLPRRARHLAGARPEGRPPRPAGRAQAVVTMKRIALACGRT